MSAYIDNVLKTFLSSQGEGMGWNNMNSRSGRTRERSWVYPRRRLQANWKPVNAEDCKSRRLLPRPTSQSTLVNHVEQGLRGVVSAAAKKYRSHLQVPALYGVSCTLLNTIPLTIIQPQFVFQSFLQRLIVEEASYLGVWKKKETLRHHGSRAATGRDRSR